MGVWGSWKVEQLDERLEHETVRADGCDPPCLPSRRRPRTGGTIGERCERAAVTAVRVSGVSDCRFAGRRLKKTARQRRAMRGTYLKRLLSSCRKLASWGLAFIFGMVIADDRARRRCMVRVFIVVRVRKVV